LLGQSYANGEAPALGRVAALDAGLGVQVPGLQIDRRCGSGLQAVIEAGMLETAENLRREYAIPRQEQDELALLSHQRAVAAHERGAFAEEIVPVEVKVRNAVTRLIDRDEPPRPDTTLEGLAALRPVVGRSDPEATVTAGNSSGQNDGAAVCIVTHAELAAELGLTPFARLVSWAVAGVPPETMGIGPVPATAKAMSRAGLSLDQMDLIELNEAFAAQVLSVLREWKL